MRGLPAHLRSFLNRWCLRPPAQAGGYMPASLRDCGAIRVLPFGTVGPCAGVFLALRKVGMTEFRVFTVGSWNGGLFGWKGAGQNCFFGEGAVGDAWSACAPSELSESMVLETASPGWRLYACVPSGLWRPCVSVPLGLWGDTCASFGTVGRYVCLCFFVPSGLRISLRNFLINFLAVPMSCGASPCH